MNNNSPFFQKFERETAIQVLSALSGIVILPSLYPPYNALFD